MNAFSNTSPETTHAGLERFLTGLLVIKSNLQELSLSNDLAKPLIVLGTMSAVTFAGRELESMQPGFAVEWALLSVVAVSAFWFFAQLLTPAMGAWSNWFKAFNGKRAQRANENSYFQHAARDPRMMSDFLRARDRNDWV